MISVDKSKRWLGRCRPLSDGDVAQLYWGVDVTATEIGEAYGAGSARDTVIAAGDAVLTGCFCKHCKAELIVRSRSEATSRLRDAEGFRARHPGEFVCGGCSDRDAAERQRLAKALWADRARRLRDLKAMPYRNYLQSPEWRERRDRAVRTARYRCQTCAGDGQLHVHHRTYARRGEELNSDLVVLCAACHEMFHQNRRLAEGGRAI